MNERTRGFTLIETVVVITIIGIVAAVIGRILSVPIGAYVSSKNRASLALIAESAIAQITRDLRSALPNSVRMPSGGGNTCIEMLPTNGGGRYRANPQTDGTKGNPVDFSTSINSFDVLAGDVTKASAGDLVTIYNLGNGVPGADAYAGTGVTTNTATNTAAISAVTNGLITLTAPKQFTVESPGQRFFTLPSTSSVYLCLNAGTSASGDGTGTLYQYPNTLSATLTACPSTAPSNAAVVASNVSTCVFSYAAGVGTRNGLATMTLGLSKNNESIQLYREVHVDNVP
jgi:MSHA biogenesis protein MshO